MLKRVLMGLMLFALCLWANAEEQLPAGDPVLEQQLRAAIQAAPQEAGPYTRLAAFLLGHGRSGEAVENYQQAIMREPTNPALFVAIAVAYLHDGHHERAQLMAQQALELDPSLGNAKKLLDYLATQEAAGETPPP